jgi:hypothetical protein
MLHLKVKFPAGSEIFNFKELFWSTVRVSIVMFYIENMFVNGDVWHSGYESEA